MSMVPGIWLSRNDMYVIACDGTNVSVEGDSKWAEYMRKRMSSPNSAYSLSKESSQQENTEFDPVAFWVNEKRSNIGTRYIETYSREAVDRNLQYLKMLAEGQKLPEQNETDFREDVRKILNSTVSNRELSKNNPKRNEKS